MNNADATTINADWSERMCLSSTVISVSISFVFGLSRAVNMFTLAWNK